MSEKLDEDPRRGSTPEIEKMGLEELVEVGKTLLEKEEYEKATLYFETAVEMTPDDPVLQNMLGLALGRSGNFSRARKCYLRALDIEPNFQKALGNIGHVFEMEGNYSKAVEFYERSLAATLDNEDLMFPPEVIEIVKEHLQNVREKIGESI